MDIPPQTSEDLGFPGRAEDLLPMVYGELRRLAGQRMAMEPAGMTLQATALVHEAWLRLAGQRKEHWENRAQFLAAAAEAMRRILIEQARKRASAKRGSGVGAVPLTETTIQVVASDEELMAVHEVIDTLAAEDESAANLVKLRFFVGMSMTEVAAALEIPLRSAERLWSFAKARMRILMNQATG